LAKDEARLAPRAPGEPAGVAGGAFHARFANSRAAPNEPSSAIRTNWLRVRTPALTNNCCTTDLTALSEDLHWFSISRLVRSPRQTAARCRLPTGAQDTILAHKIRRA